MLLVESRNIVCYKNWLLAFVLESELLWFPKLLDEAERGRGLSSCIPGSEGLGRGAGRCWHCCWGRPGLVLGELFALKVGHDSYRPKNIRL